MAFLSGPSNFITRQITESCSRPLFIYFRTAVPAFFDAWLLVRILLWDDIVRDRATGIIKEGGINKKRGGHTKKSRGKAIPQSRKFFSSKNNLNHLMIFTAPLEYIGFALLIYGAVDGFYHDWQHYLDLSKTCDNTKRNGPLHRENNSGGTFPNAGGNAVTMGTLIQDQARWGSSPTGFSPPIGWYNVTFECEFVSPLGPSVTYGLYIRTVGGFPTGDILVDEVQTVARQTVTLLGNIDVYFPFLTGNQLQWIIKGPPVPVGLQVSDARVIVVRTGFSPVPPST